MIRIHVFGDSHVSVLEAGAEQVAWSRPAPGLGLAFYSRHGGNWLEFETRVEVDGVHLSCGRIPGVEPVSYTVNDLSGRYVFSAPLHSPPIVRSAVWKTHCPWTVSEAHPNLTPLSTAVIEQWVHDHTLTRLTMLRTLRSCGYDVAVVEPPRPLLRAPAIYGLSPDVVVAVDRIFRHYVAERLRELSVPVIPVPDHTQSGGLTPEDYAAAHVGDAHHGSVAFGREMVERIVRFAERERTAKEVGPDRAARLEAGAPTSMVEG